MKKTMKKTYKVSLLSVVMGIVLLAADVSAQPLAAGKSKYIGNILSLNFYTNFSKVWNQVSPENAGKWGSVEGVMDGYNWGPLDNIYNYAQTNKLIYKHHALVWGSQYPSWITTVDSATQRAQVEEWIKLVGARYPKMDMVDVVNEPFHTPLPFMHALGDAGKTGWDWVVQSFQWARQYCPSTTKLLLNEYSVTNSNSTTDKYIALIDTLNVRGLIDGIGIQSHSFETKGVSPATISANMARLGALGLPIYITEFDINEPVDSIQLQSYKTYFPILWESPAVKGITFWGYMQYNIWQKDAWLMDSRYTERPAMQWLRQYVLAPPRPVLVSPLSATGIACNPRLVWNASDSGATYHLQIATTSAFSTIVFDTTVTDTVLRVTPLDPNSVFYWRVSAANTLATGEYSSVAYFVTGNILAVAEAGTVPNTYALSQNYPNPFNPSTQIEYSMPKSGYVSLKIFNVLGKEVATLFSGVQQIGTHRVAFDGSGLASGVYLYRLQASGFVDTKRMILMK
jgi:endo-1,4-beta-xylanase